MSGDNIKVSQYLTFLIDSEIYCVEVTKTREIIQKENISVVPGMSEYMRGIINVRGCIIPIMDLKEKIGLGKFESASDVHIIIIEVKSGKDPLTFGILADKVLEVIHLENTLITPPPKIGMRRNLDYISGIGKADNSVMMILDIDKIIGSGAISLSAQETARI